MMIVLTVWGVTHHVAWPVAWVHGLAGVAVLSAVTAVGSAIWKGIASRHRQRRS